MLHHSVRLDLTDPSLDRILDVLLSADIILLATSSLSLLQPPMLRQVLSSLRYHRNVHLVVDDVYASSIPACSARYLQKLQSQIRKEIVALFPDGDSARGPTIHFASTDLAIEANTNFRGSTVQPLHTAAPTLDLRVTTDQFQAAYLASGISNLSSSLLRVLSSTNQENGPPAISIDSALSLASSALMSARNECQRSSAEVVELRSRCSSLRERIDDVDAASKHRIFGDGQEVRDDIITARSKIQGWFDSTTWWRLPWKVDDIEGELRPIIGAVYCRDLERKVQSSAAACLCVLTVFPSWYTKLGFSPLFKRT